MTKITYNFGEPIVLERSKKKGKKKNRISKEMRQSEQHLVRGMRRTLKATDQGLRRYHKASRQSAKKSSDDAVLDFVPNVAEGMVETMRGLALVPLDMMRAAYVPQARRAVRRSLRVVTRAVDDNL